MPEVPSSEQDQGILPRLISALVGRRREVKKLMKDKRATPEQLAKDLLILTPGVGMDVQGDGKGQQYRTPQQVIKESGCDVMIVGRGIYGALLNSDAPRSEAIEQVKAQAQRYREAGWQAYLERVQPRNST